MKTFTKTLAALVAVSLAALALSSCKKVQPTELTEASTNATVIKGSVQYFKTTTTGGFETNYSAVADDAVVTITTKIKTGNIIVDKDGNKIDETIASVQSAPIVDRVFQANLPVAPGEKYDVEVRCEFEVSGYQKSFNYQEVEGKTVKMPTDETLKGTCKYKGMKEIKVAYGQTFVCNIIADFDGFEDTAQKGQVDSSTAE